ncbi:MAG: hypothetical protein F6J98_09820 [Moorea sp. SIO4G2]|uniref:helix-turn-helix domain-containing protein n=1 Tax=unclassified Moorena TaxID=2683338 RepID=UPI0013C062C6|nr:MULTISPECIES: helix-turn-helix transcriptional regulator [unclassified Moorena]NEO08755.1 hypothetical protein [Moorena sp. SIO3I8]NEO60709.1 hypothetical protein [Moorena sp. SIO4G2]NEP23055.1 hypothetical protein [Moorena sp. SIO3I6]NEQ61457.1 hypothetical protein [Moorena sp. SIO4A1]
MSYIEVRSDKKVRIKNFPKILHRLCKQSKGGITKVSRASGIPRASIYSILTGAVTCIPEDTLRRLEAALSVDFGVVFNYDSDLTQEVDGSFTRIDLVHREVSDQYQTE